MLKKDFPSNGASDASQKGIWSSMLDGVASGKRLPEKNILVLGELYHPAITHEHL
jgi:hypothetical protein